ncbi:MAG: site-specific integrase [Nanoarchaeota archaeon]
MVNKIKIPLRVINTEKQLLGVKKWKIAEIDKKSVALFVKDLQLGKITGNQMCAGTLWVYVTNLKIALEFLKKPVSTITPKDTEKLSEVLLKDELRYSIKTKDKEGNLTRESKTYTETSKIKIKVSMIKFLEWKLKDKADKLTKILKVKPRLKMPTPDYLSETQVEKLFKACSTNTEKFFIAVLFDSGARAEEFHNIRKEDIELPKGDNNFVKLSLKEEYSKTKGRTIGLYWKYSLSAVRDYLEERIREGIQPEEPVFKMKYKTMRKWLNDFGKQILGRKVYYHLFRHSSSSHYADKLNRQQLCVRYGWAFRSPMVDRYINRTSLGEKEIEEKFEKTEIEDLKVELEEFKHKNKLKDVEINTLKDNVADIMAYIKENVDKAKNNIEASEKTKSVPAS